MMMSVGDGSESARRGAGVDAFLTKPVKHSDLLDALATLFRVSTRRPAPNARSSHRRGPSNGCECSSPKTTR